MACLRASRGRQMSWRWRRLRSSKSATRDEARLRQQPRSGRIAQFHHGRTPPGLASQADPEAATANTRPASCPLLSASSASIKNRTTSARN
jgi:hypothetical protein